MNRYSTPRPARRWTAILSLTAVFVGLGALTPAMARADARSDRERDHIRREFDMIRRDERRLDDLRHWREAARDRHDWRRVHDLDRQIDRLQDHIAQARRDVERDAARLRRDRERDGYRNGSGGSYRGDYPGGYRDDGRGGYRNGEDTGRRYPDGR